MPKINISNDQKKIIEYNNGNSIVSASAGSGKTFTMIEKIVNIIVNENVKIQDLLVVTFTNSAAREMRMKI
ncbi:MAG: UvrD-helicase domain-containing protein, partial [bacterium]